MALRLRYAGEFLSQKGVTWRVEILQEAENAFTVGELTFPADSPLVIEWPERAPEEPICGSMATLRIESPGDRTYVDLYTEIPGDVRMDVYRNGDLYWVGCLDTETYREPYDRGAFYDVEFTFYDFGLLGRIPYALSGQKTLLQILQAALGSIHMNYPTLDQSMVSTRFTNDSAVTLSALSIASENFYDEDGIAMDYERVLEGVLQPLALKMIQRAGKIWIFDINALWQQQARRLVWNATGQEMGTGRVYNNIKITFSAYALAKLLPDFLYGDTYGASYVNTAHGSVLTPERYSFYLGPYFIQVPDNIGFTIFLSSDASKCTGLAGIGPQNRYFKILPMLGGIETEGVAVGFRAGHVLVDSGNTILKGIDPGSHPQSVALRTKRIFLPALDNDGQNGHFVRILMDMLADPRYNPFEEPGEDLGTENESVNYEEFKSWGQQAFVPVAIVLYNASGTALYHYRNAGITAHGHWADSVAACAAWGEVGDGWVQGEASFGDAWLAYYDNEQDLIYGNGCIGWKTNRQNFGKPWSEGRQASKRKLYYTTANNERAQWGGFLSFQRMPDGQYIPYPPAGGYLEVRVYNGVYIFDDTDQFHADASGGFFDEGLYDKIRWLLYKSPEVSVVRRTLTYEEATMEDVEYSGVANPDAKEDLELETICGTVPTPCPTARGAFLRAANGLQVTQFKRNNRVESAEQLLVGTLFSQYASRKVVLSGEIELESGLNVFLDDAQPATRRFMITGEEQDLISDCSNATFLEVRLDEYTAE